MNAAEKLLSFRDGREHGLRARWIIPIAADPLHDAVLGVRDGRITRVVANSLWDGEPPNDLGDVALMPALVNAHTHLEFSELREPLGQAGLEFAEWIPLVVGLRRTRAAAQQTGSTRQGVSESLDSGVAAVGEIATAGWPASEFAAAELGGIVFREFLGWDPAGVPELLSAAREHVSTPIGPNWRPGLSPHAPYTVCRELLDGLIEIARRTAAPLAMHLGESPAELEFLATGRGPLRSMLESAGIWRDDFWNGPGSCAAILERLSQASRVLVIHGNFFVTRERNFLAEHRNSMTLVYCPRTHMHFGHRKYPLAVNLRAGVSVAIGTDSRASNPDLGLWGELQEIARQDLVPAQTILKLGTIAGAKALGLEQSLGTLEAGRPAKLCVVGPIRAADTNSLYRELFSTNTDCRGLGWTSTD